MTTFDIIDLIYPEWHRRAACHPENGHSPETWFPCAPAGSGSGSRRAVEAAIHEAIRICNTCPVKRQCLDDALSRRESVGVWGGRVFNPKGESDAA